MKKNPQDPLEAHQASNIETYSPDLQADLLQLNREGQKPTIPGSPVTDSRVTTVYDARPINATDLFRELTSLAPSNSLTLSFAVPPGTIAVVKFFSYATAVVVDVFGWPTTTILTSFTVNGLPVTSYTSFNAQGGSLNADRVPCYILADENNIIAMNLTSSAGDDGGNVWLAFYGQLLLKSGRPLPFEPGVSIPEPVYVVGNPNKTSVPSGES